MHEKHHQRSRASFCCPQDESIGWAFERAIQDPRVLTIRDSDHNEETLEYEQSPTFENALHAELVSSDELLGRSDELIQDLPSYERMAVPFHPYQANL